LKTAGLSRFSEDEYIPSACLPVIPPGSPFPRFDP